MQKTILKQETKENLPQKQNNKKLNFKDIESFYLNKKHNDSLLGLEYERLSLDRTTFKNASYSTMEKIIQDFSTSQGWELVYDSSIVIGAKSKNNTSISLEPGCQLELSISPKQNVFDIQLELNKIIEILDSIALNYNVIFLGYGISPLSTIQEIQILNKKRYEIMNNYLPSANYGELCPKMMRQSAGIQINIDFKNKNDLYYKLKFYNLIMPFLNGLFSNSPIENNVLGEYKSYRSHVWHFCGSQRCNFFYKNVFKKLFQKKNIIKNYIQEVLNVPMVYIEKEGKIIPINGKMTFDEYLKKGYYGYFATLEDYILHQSLCFPDVRLKNYIEIRNHDSSNPKMALALCALYLGLSKCSSDWLLEQFRFLNFNDIDFYSKEAAKNGLDFKIKEKSNIDGWMVVEKIFNISKSALIQNERIYLEPILEMINSRKTQADILIDYNINNAFDLIEFNYEKMLRKF